MFERQTETPPIDQRSSPLLNQQRYRLPKKPQVLVYKGLKRMERFLEGLRRTRSG